MSSVLYGLSVTSGSGAGPAQHGLGHAACPGASSGCLCPHACLSVPRGKIPLGEKLSWRKQRGAPNLPSLPGPGSPSERAEACVRVRAHVCGGPRVRLPRCGVGVTARTCVSKTNVPWASFWGHLYVAGHGPDVRFRCVMCPVTTGAQGESGWGRGRARQGFLHPGQTGQVQGQGKRCLGLGEGKSDQGG